MLDAEIIKQKSLDDELWILCSEQSNDLIPKPECQVGYVYWGVGRSIGQIAACNGLTCDNMTRFKGMGYKAGAYVLFSEFHTDDDPSIGTWTPKVRLGSVDLGDGKAELTSVLLQAEIDMLETHDQWLSIMPRRLQIAPSYEWMCEQNKKQLEFITNYYNSLLIENTR
jgi:hypothetical protein